MDIKISQESREGYDATVVEPLETASDFGFFHIIPSRINERTDLTSSMKIVYGFLFTFNNQQKPMFGSNEFIARSCGMETRYVANILAKLESLRLIERIYINNNPQEGRATIRCLPLSPISDSYHSGVKPLSLRSDHSIIISSTTSSEDTKKNPDTPLKGKEPIPLPPSRKFSSLEDLKSPELLKELQTEFPKLIGIEKKLDYMYDWALSKGKRYKNYLSFAKNWLRRDVATLENGGIVPGLFIKKELYEGKNIL